MEKKLLIIAGPTAVGKTALSLQWAEENNAEILSCDSLLVYQGMDVGTAKPTPEEQKRVKHHGIDLVPVRQQYTIKDYVEMAKGIVEDILGRGKTVLITGGSGFYLKSFFSPVLDDMPIPEKVERVVSAIFENQGLEGLMAELKKRNPGGTGNLDVQNPRRVLKALQRCMASGKTVAEFQHSFAEQEMPYSDFEKTVWLLHRSTESLRLRIEKRMKQILEGGLVEEVKRLLDDGLLENPSASGAIGYRETIAWLEKDEPVEVLEESIVQNTVKLIAKQRKWFRHQLVASRVVDLDAEV